MSVNPDSIPRYAEPTWDELREPEPTDEECYRDCTHQDACRRLYATFVDNTEHVGWFEDMVRRLGCKNCEQCQ